MDVADLCNAETRERPGEPLQTEMNCLHRKSSRLAKIAKSQAVDGPENKIDELSASEFVTIAACYLFLHARYEYSSSVFAAMMKSFLCKPPILWVHQFNVTLPHSVMISG